MTTPSDSQPASVDVLLPCPFCGGNPLGGRPSGIVECEDCGACTSGFGDWNTRLASLADAPAGAGDERIAREMDQPPPTAGDLAAFGASDAACYLYPEAHQAAERAAYCAGAAAHATATTGEFQDMAAALRNTPAQALREAGYLDRAADILAATRLAVPAGVGREEVAREVDPEAFEPTDNYDRKISRDMRRADAFSAADRVLGLALAQPAAGWKLVPVEADDAMATAAARELQRQSSSLGWEPTAVWSAMLAAAPERAS